MLFEQKRFSCFQAESGNSRRGTHFQRMGTDTRNIESEIVVFPCYFDGHRSALLTR